MPATENYAEVLSGPGEKHVHAAPVHFMAHIAVIHVAVIHLVEYRFV